MPRFDHASCTLPQTWPPTGESVLVLAMRRPRGWWLKAVREAGGIVTDIAGAQAKAAQGAFVAGNPSIHPWLLETVQRAAESR